MEDNNNTNTTKFIERIHLSPLIDQIAKEEKDGIKKCVDEKIRRYNSNVFLIRFSSAAAILLSVIMFSFYLFMEKPLSTGGLVKVESLNGTQKTVSLPDGTTVTMNSGSELQYPSSFKKEVRDVYLKGEAYFEVVHNSKSPLIVHSSDVQIKVYGTKFNVQSYEGSNNVEVTLMEGRVGIKTDTHDALEMNLYPGQQAVYSKKDKEITTREIDSQLQASWLDGNFYFDQKTLSEIAILLGKRFDKEIQITSDRLKNVCFSGEFKSGESLEQILRIITFDERMDFVVEGDAVYIREK